VQSLVQLGANKEGHDGGRLTALQKAPSKGNAEMVLLLVALGVGVHAKNAKGETALQSSVAKGQHEVARALTEVGKRMRVREEQKCAQ
jgi:ankyrin repeat protein